jgi:hypothetical protein
MIRQFQFEAEVYQSLSCVPMTARRKLDRLGIKLSLQEWQQLGRGERLMICHAPAASAEECEALGLFIEEAVVGRCGSPPRHLPEQGRKAAEPPSLPPPRVVANAQALGVVLSARDWQRLDDDQRYALIKLGDIEQPSHNFKPALAEFLPNSGPTVSA